MLYKGILLFLLFILSALSSSVFAHSAHDEYVVLYNGQKGIANNIKLVSPNNNFFLPEEISPEVYKTGANLNLSVESENNVPDESVRWATGELTGDLTGDNITIPLSKPGSYPIVLEVTTPQEKVSHLIQVNVTGKDNFSFPDVKIFVGGKEINDESPVDVDLIEEILFEAKSENHGLKYIWNFDNGEIKEGRSVAYKFPEGPYLVSPVLRVVDEEGVYKDRQFTLKNTSFGSENASKNNDYTVLLIATTIFLVVLVFLLVKAKKYLKSRV